MEEAIAILIGDQWIKVQDPIIDGDYLVARCTNSFELINARVSSIKAWKQVAQPQATRVMPAFCPWSSER